jgi:hypothetical protein
MKAFQKDGTLSIEGEMVVGDLYNALQPFFKEQDNHSSIWQLQVLLSETIVALAGQRHQEIEAAAAVLPVPETPVAPPTAPVPPLEPELPY